jgi:hypothetical protein
MKLARLFNTNIRQTKGYKIKNIRHISSRSGMDERAEKQSFGMQLLLARLDDS